jgi:hypothetical protein
VSRLVLQGIAIDRYTEESITYGESSVASFEAVPEKEPFLWIHDSAWEHPKKWMIPEDLQDYIMYVLGLIDTLTLFRFDPEACEPLRIHTLGVETISDFLRGGFQDPEPIAVSHLYDIVHQWENIVQEESCESDDYVEWIAKQLDFPLDSSEDDYLSFRRIVRFFEGDDRILEKAAGIALGQNQQLLLHAGRFSREEECEPLDELFTRLGAQSGYHRGLEISTYWTEDDREFHRPWIRLISAPRPYVSMSGPPSILGTLFQNKLGGKSDLPDGISELHLHIKSK